MRTVAMTEEYAVQIANWDYEYPYEFYNMEGSEEAVQELLAGSYQAVVAGEDVIGYFCTGKAAQVPAGQLAGIYDEPGIDIGVGMRPDLTGQKRGRPFFSFVLDHIDQGGLDLRLTVAAFNRRAIHLYEVFDFRIVNSFLRGNTEFYVMKR
ncbi:GNAT family N-acetyltransferase [Ectobacillus antri]|jgi:ribosomal-protein-alanine N-acetyltransferase|uniref:GNAT family N-acetyltransferase n=1 Tax=Ectobacillus antri TaxID=2486280 RepID=A0ABT6H4S3_9BACI|nr:GNAT family N-acetyltransferase [Ectobacillus antri]MDG4658390.1 GNAT family N-acetyltransferase [Ectobacillus antri]MDG5753724.1 GNAT family N-acetyltransferase [Ectobacillus antri]